MLCMIRKANHPDLDCRGDQDPIVRREADLHETVEQTGQKERRWAVTLSDAGSGQCSDGCDIRRT